MGGSRIKRKLMKRFGAMLALAAMMASDVVEAANCPSKKDKNWCKGDQYNKKGSDGKTDCECECKWSESNNKSRPTSSSTPKARKSTRNPASRMTKARPRRRSADAKPSQPPVTRPALR